MNRYFYLFFLLFFLPVVTVVAMEKTNTSTPTTQGKAPAPKAMVHYDESWLDDEEEEEPARPNTRWGKFMTKMDNAALAMKALYHFKLKPWWQEKHGKEITIAAGTTLATLAAAYVYYKKSLKPSTDFISVLKSKHPSHQDSHSINVVK